MKVSYNWLQDYLIKKLPEPNKLAEILTLHAFEVEELEKKGTDWVFDINITPNRGFDCLSHWGLAREIAALTNNKLKSIDLSIPKETEKKISQVLSVEIKAKDLCSRYTARLISDVKIGDSPKWLKDRLETVGVRAINNAVDITNYFSLGYGQPMHAFDADKIAKENDVYKIIVRRAQKGEKVKTLDDQNRELDDQTLLICDPKKIIALAGVMGASNTEVSGTTKNIILESAIFEPKNIRLTSKRIGLKSEASIRFEAGFDSNITSCALDMATAMFCDLTQGQTLKGMIDIYSEKRKPKKIRLSLKKVNSLLGVDIPPKEIKNILENLGFSIKQSNGKKEIFEIIVSTFRNDIELQADLIEEIGRVWGYEKIKPQVPSATLIPPQKNESVFYENKVREILSGLGFSEVYNYSFYGEEVASICNLENLEVLNPSSQYQKYLRTCLVPGILKNIKDNLKNFSDIRIFELGKNYELSGKKKILETKKLAGALCFKDKKENIEEFYILKGVIDALFQKLGISDIWYDDQLKDLKPNVLNFFNSSKRAEIKSENQILGFVGEISPQILKSMDIKFKPVVFEINFEILTKLATEERIYLEPFKYPALVRDLAVLVDQGTKVVEVTNIIENTGGKLLQDTDLFDIYEGEGLPEGRVSMAFHLIYQAEDHTLSEREVDEIHNKIFQALEDKGWEVRK